jgi:quinol-cytochrome oxidoreductase complex cytochrome b subunit
MLVITEIYFYKNRMKRINLGRGAVLTLVAMLLVTSIILPAETGSRANPEVTPLPILSDWYFLALYQMLKYMDPYWATIWTVGIPFVTIALAFLDWGQERNAWRRPIFTMIGILAFIEFVVFSLLIIANQANIDRDPPYWFAHMVFFIAIGQFWHWGLYRQKLPMAIWVGFNLAISSWYLFFWHAWAGKGLAFQKLLMLMQGQDVGSWNPTNLYWNILWLAFSVFQAVLFLGLWATDAKRPAEDKNAQSKAIPPAATEKSLAGATTA